MKLIMLPGLPVLSVTQQNTLKTDIGVCWLRQAVWQCSVPLEFHTKYKQWARCTVG